MRFLIIIIIIIFNSSIILSNIYDNAHDKMLNYLGKWKIIDNYCANICELRKSNINQILNIRYKDYVVVENTGKAFFHLLNDDYVSNFYRFAHSYEIVDVSTLDYYEKKRNPYEDILAKELLSEIYIEKIVIYGADKSNIYVPLYDFIILGEDRLLLNAEYILERVK